MRMSEIGSGFGVLVILVLTAAGIGGWVWNIVKIAESMDATVTGMFVARCIGVFVAPVGSILGFM